MGSALWIAISGLNASSKQLDVIGNNIANSNTMGFKAGKAYFANVLSQSLSGGSSGMMQIGQGVTVADVATQFSQGSLESTASGLDLAVDGGGFFIAQDSGGSSYYTRAGAMHIDGNGYLVDVNNYRIQGYAPGSASLGDVNTSGAQSAPVTTDDLLRRAQPRRQGCSGRQLLLFPDGLRHAGRGPHPGRDLHEDRG